jgi:hypothetical protein
VGKRLQRDVTTNPTSKEAMIFMKRLRYLLPLVFIGGVGCATGIHVTRVSAADAQITGNPWNLAMTQFKMSITRHITKCGDEVSGTVEVIATPVTAVDDDQRYVLESNGWWATSDITSTLAPNGMSTGLNAQSTDTTATVISNVVGTVAQVAIGAAAGAPGVKAPLELCKAEVAAAVAELYPKGATKPLRDRVDKDVADLANATARVALLTAQASADKSYKAELAKALGEQDTLRVALDKDQKQLTKDLNLTSNTQVVTWPRKASDLRQDTPYTLNDKVLQNWSVSADPQSAKEQFSVYLALYRQDEKGEWVAPTTPPHSDEKVGVPVRLARIGRLLVCTQEKCPPYLREDFLESPKQRSFDQVVLQLGQLITVPLTGGTFKAENAVIALDGNGLPTSIEVAEKVAGAAAASGAAKDTASQLSALPGQVRAAELARTQAQVNQLNAEIALATAQSTAGEQRATGAVAAQTALINAQNSLATARLNAGLPAQTAEAAAATALLNAQAALATAQANAANVPQESALAAQTTLINAQTAQINAAAALAKAKALAP